MRKIQFLTNVLLLFIGLALAGVYWRGTAQTTLLMTVMNSIRLIDGKQLLPDP
jgi:hypothetical protein